MSITPNQAPPRPRRWLRTAMLAAWLGYALWAYATGRASAGEAVALALAAVGALALLALYEGWWRRPIRRPGEAAPEDAGEDRRDVPSALDDLKFPAAMAAALLLAMTLLGFPGGGLGAGLLAIGALGLFGWLALNRAIGG